MIRKRYRKILTFFAFAIIKIILWDLILNKLGFRKAVLKTRSRRQQRIASGFRKLAIDMGGVMIKVGQFLSSRVDVLPEEITAELAELQDEVPPVDYQYIKEIVETVFNDSIDSIFLEFNPEPVAAASLGQVHQAKLPRDLSASEEILHVVVKVQRPDIHNIVDTDLSALQTVSRWMMLYKPISRRADIPALLNEFSKTLYEELDYIAEGKNAETFASNFVSRTDICVPKVIWSRTRESVLTLEDVTGIKITNYQAITEAGIERSKVADRLIDMYLEQIFEHGFFHADPHPGNLFVSQDADDPDEWVLTFVDFGMVGTISENTRKGMRELVIGIGTQDSSRIVKGYQILDFLLPGANIERIQEAEQKLFDRFWGMSMSELKSIDFSEVHDFSIEFRELLYEMPFQIPKDIIYLVRCVAILSGMATGLDPDFNVWEKIMPYAQKLIKEEVTGNWEYWTEELLKWGQVIVRMPMRIDTILSDLESGSLKLSSPGLEAKVDRLNKTQRKTYLSIVFLGLFLGSIQLLVNDLLVPGFIVLAFSILALIRVLLP